MLKKRPNEFLYSLFTLLAAVIVVHAFWVAAVRPNAQRVQAEQAAAMKADPAYVAERSLWVIVKDWEQESCVVLMLWALAMIGYKWREVSREHDVFERGLLQIPECLRVRPELHPRPQGVRS